MNYTSDDFAAFLIFAGPPGIPNKPLGQSDLDVRLDYVGKCDRFCQEYFGTKEGMSDDKLQLAVSDRHAQRLILHYQEDWVQFYSAFTKWYAIHKEMSQDVEFDRREMGVLTLAEIAEWKRK